MAEDVLKGKRPCRITELERLMYLIIYLINLELPWSKIKSTNYDDKRNKIISIHNKINIAKLCVNLPYQLLFILNDIKELTFESKPNYELYIKNFQNIFSLDKSNEKEFCWIKKMNDNQKNINKYSDIEYLFL